MRHHFALVVAIFTCAALIFVSTGQMVAQEKQTTKEPLQYSGRVTVVDKTTKTVTIQAKTSIISVKLTDQTLFTYRNKPGSIDDLKEGRRVTVLADPAKQKDIVALRIDVREGK